jgi:hypothetical protein
MDTICLLSYGVDNDKYLGEFAVSPSGLSRMALDYVHALRGACDGLLMVHLDSDKGIVIIDEKERHYYFTIHTIKRVPCEL